jgi:SAM-dependent methyltransferase
LTGSSARKLWRAGRARLGRYVRPARVRQGSRRLLERLLGRGVELDPGLAAREPLFRAPPLTPELVAAIRLISPQLELFPDEASRRLWEADQNGACWGEYDALEPFLARLPEPAQALELGPGLGRSAVFLTKKLGWRRCALHLYDATGSSTRYTMQGPRFADSFCGNLPLLEGVLAFNGVANARIFDAAQPGVSLRSLPGPYDLIYSFYAVGFHWSLEHFLPEIDALLAPGGTAFFTVPRDFAPFPGLERFRDERVTWKTVWPKDRYLDLLVLGKAARTA